VNPFDDYERLMAEEGPKAIRKLRGSDCDEALAEDIVEELALEVLRRLPHEAYEVKRAAFLGLVRYRWIDEVDRRVRERDAWQAAALLRVPPDYGPASMVERWEEIRHYLEMLPPHEARVWKRSIQNFTDGQIAEQLDLPEPTVRVYRSRSQGKIRRWREEFKGVVLGFFYGAHVRHPQLMSLGGVASAGLFCAWMAATTSPVAAAPSHPGGLVAHRPAVASIVGPPEHAGPSDTATAAGGSGHVAGAGANGARRNGSLKDSAPIASASVGDKNLVSTGAHAYKREDGRTFVQDAEGCVINGIDLSLTGVQCREASTN
jgi:DNA-directed RNA polymerase specialized sigma24 family protein